MTIKRHDGLAVTSKIHRQVLDELVQLDIREFTLHEHHDFWINIRTQLMFRLNASEEDTGYDGVYTLLQCIADRVSVAKLFESLEGGPAYYATLYASGIPRVLEIITNSVIRHPDRYTDDETREMVSWICKICTIYEYGDSEPNVILKNVGASIDKWCQVTGNDNVCPIRAYVFEPRALYMGWKRPRLVQATPDTPALPSDEDYFNHLLGKVPTDQHADALVSLATAGVDPELLEAIAQAGGLDLDT